jgi:hypothetical protein
MLAPYRHTRATYINNKRKKKEWFEGKEEKIRLKKNRQTEASPSYTTNLSGWTASKR